MSLTGDRSRSGEGRVNRAVVKDALLTGIALTVPLAVTILLLVFVVRFLASLLQPFVGSVVALLGLGTALEVLAVYLFAVVVIVIGLLVVGLAAKTSQGRRIERTVTGAIERIPGIGSVYGSFTEMSELLLDSDSQSFQEVVLVEFPTDGSYAVAFLSAETPEFVLESTGHDAMRTVFMPMAPNPVMGGYVLYVSEDRLYDVDMTVEEGIHSIVTSGVAVGEDSDTSILEEDEEE